ncbi:MAG: class I SAM-dependent methyltransferase [Candidatus Omnitrophica bacterium]|nr:class I SAM-dependent methyltransferase [Candidatus Omnitrophota bacterium]
MVENIFLKLIKDPFGFIKRGLYKTIIAPFKYGKGNDYDAKSYWNDRFRKYDHALRGVGDEGLSEEENKKAYEEAAGVFRGLCLQENIDFNNINVLEIGCGTGFYTQILHGLGVQHYTGVDITDALFSGLAKKFSKYTFIMKDITADTIEGKFGLVVMIDVIEHIVIESKFSAAMENVKKCLSGDGIFILAPIMHESKRHLFHTRSYSSDDIKREFPGYVFSKLTPFRGSYIVSIRKQGGDVVNEK